MVHHDGSGNVRVGVINPGMAIVTAIELLT